EIFYAPNQITLLRLVFIPFVILSIFYGEYHAALALVLAAGLSDGLDGVVARRFGQQTTLGTFLDPIVDKLLLSSSFIALGVAHQLPWWIVILVLSRDVLIMAVALVIMLATSLRSFPPSIYGKINTAAQILTVLLTLVVLLWPVNLVEWMR